MTWKNLKVFISSTFNDMHAERDYLIKVVMPELNEWCEKRKIRVKEIDLRWGITEEDSTANNVVNTCLKGIDDCKPFFICFLGQRRGWVPTMGDINDELLKKYPNIMKSIGEKSITEFEIEKALQEKMHCIFLFREDNYTNTLNNEQLKIYTNADNPNSEREDELLLKFKKSLSNLDITATYSATFDQSIKSRELLCKGESAMKGRFTNFIVEKKPLNTFIVNAMKEIIEKRYPFVEKKTTLLENEIAEQEAFLQSMLEGYVKNSYAELISEYIRDKNSDYSLLICGQSGLGKSSLISYTINQLQIKNARIAYRFCGVSANSLSFLDVINSILIQYGFQTYDTATDIVLNASIILDKLSKLKIKIFIDAINETKNSDLFLKFFSRKLPKGLKVVFTAKTESKYDGLIELGKKNNYFRCVFLTANTSKEFKTEIINDYLSNFLKKIDGKDVDLITSLSQSNNPLFLKALLYELKTSGTHESLTGQIKDMGETPESVFDYILQRLENDFYGENINSKKFISTIFSLLSESNDGLSENEMSSAFQIIFNEDVAELIDEYRIVVRSVRQFMARKENRVSLCFDSFASAAKKRYSNLSKASNSVLAEVYLQNCGENFSEGSRRDFICLPLHLFKCGKNDVLENILLDYNYLYNKILKAKLNSLLNDFEYLSQLSTELYYIKTCLQLNSPKINRNKNFLPIVLFSCFNGVKNTKLANLLKKADEMTSTPYFKPVISNQINDDYYKKAELQNGETVEGFFIDNLPMGFVGYDDYVIYPSKNFSFIIYDVINKNVIKEIFADSLVYANSKFFNEESKETASQQQQLKVVNGWLYVSTALGFIYRVNIDTEELQLISTKYNAMIVGDSYSFYDGSIYLFERQGKNDLGFSAIYGINEKNILYKINETTLLKEAETYIVGSVVYSTMIDGMIYLSVHDIKKRKIFFVGYDAQSLKLMFSEECGIDSNFEEVFLNSSFVCDSVKEKYKQRESICEVQYNVKDYFITILGSVYSKALNVAPLEYDRVCYENDWKLSCIYKEKCYKLSDDYSMLLEVDFDTMESKVKSTNGEFFDIIKEYKMQDISISDFIILNDTICIFINNRCTIVSFSFKDLALLGETTIDFSEYCSTDIYEVIGTIEENLNVEVLNENYLVFTVVLVLDENYDNQFKKLVVYDVNSHRLHILNEQLKPTSLNFCINKDTIFYRNGNSINTFNFRDNQINEIYQNTNSRRFIFGVIDDKLYLSYFGSFVIYDIASKKVILEQYDNHALPHGRLFDYGKVLCSSFANIIRFCDREFKLVDFKQYIDDICNARVFGKYWLTDNSVYSLMNLMSLGKKKVFLADNLDGDEMAFVFCGAKNYQWMLDVDKKGKKRTLFQKIKLYFLMRKITKMSYTKKINNRTHKELVEYFDQDK